MKTKAWLMGLGLLVVLGGLLLVDGGVGAGAAAERLADDKEVTKNPAMLLSPTMKAGEVSVYGIRLGDSTDKLPSDGSVTAVGVPDRSQDSIYVGRNVKYYADDKKIYRITVTGDITKQLPTYDAARLQMALGKADDIVTSPSGEDTLLSFFSRHVQYTVHAYRSLSLVTDVDIYAP